MKTHCSQLIAGILIASVFTGHAQDKPGSADHPLLKRYKDSKIFQYEQEDYVDYRLALGKSLNPSIPANEGRSIEKEATLEGRLTRISYLAPAGRSALEVFRNYEKELKDAGFQVIFKGEKEELGFRFSQRYQGVFSQIFEYNDSDNRYLAARLERPEGTVTVSLFVCAYDMGLTGGLNPVKGQPLVQLDIVEDKAMEQKMVLVKAAEMENQISANGRIALYGILFDTDKATIRSDSEPTLSEIVLLLKGNPDLRILVVGHTDTDGSFEYNKDLSQRRAAAVAARLVADGIPADRLFPVGVSFASPIATNATEEGKSKNRRVELVDMQKARQK